MPPNMPAPESKGSVGLLASGPMFPSLASTIGFGFKIKTSVVAFSYRMEVDRFYVGLAVAGSAKESLFEVLLVFLRNQLPALPGGRGND